MELNVLKRMDPERFGGWADLPQDVVELISCKLGEHEHGGGEVRRIRSVCRSWRSSVPPLHPIFSRCFPVRCSLLGLGMNINININMGAVFLARPYSNPDRRAWLVSVREVSPGKLIPCHPLTYQEYTTKATMTSTYYDADTTEFVASWYETSAALPVALLNQGLGLGLVGLCQGDQDSTDRKRQLVMFSRSRPSHGKEEEEEIRSSSDNQLGGETAIINSASAAAKQLVGAMCGCEEFESFAVFEGRLYAIDCKAHVFVLDSENMELVRISIFENMERAKKDLVVSDGNLHLVLTIWNEDCQVHNLFVDNPMIEEIIRYKRYFIHTRQVGILSRESVLFIGKACTFSIPKDSLPCSWKGNCVVYLQPDQDEIMVVHLAEGGSPVQFHKISELPGCSDLFDPPPLGMPA